MNKKYQWLALVLAVLLLLTGAGCAQQDPEPVPVASEATDAPASEATEPEPEPEPDEPEAAQPEPEAESETEPETEPETEAETEAATGYPEPLPTGIQLDPAAFDLFAFRIGYEVEWFSDDETANAQFAALVNANTNITVGEEDRNILSEGDFLTLHPGGVKQQFSLRNGNLVLDGTAFETAPEDYAALKALYEDANQPGTSYAQWLVYANPTRITGARFHTEKSGGVAPASDELLASLIEMARFVPVAPGSGDDTPFVLEQIVPDRTTFRLWLDFDNGNGASGDLFNTLTFTGTTLKVESSDLGFGCTYTTSQEYADRILALLDAAPTPSTDANPDSGYPEDAEPQDEEPAEYIPPADTGKPVIYLYPEQTTDVNVTLDFQGKLNYTFPTYNNGWNVTAQPDGTLTNIGDGSTHYYLFWDGYPDKTDWDLSRGFVVKGSELEVFFREKLPALGLLPREYNDFITFWTPKMKDNPYNLISFSTTEYEQVAPLTVTPAPDTMLRVHMVYRPLEKPVDVAAQTLPVPPARDGFTVVEWGGTELGGLTA